MTKYPFVVSVHRLAGGRQPVFQQHSFEDIVEALRKMDECGRDASVMLVQVSCVLKEVTYQRRPRLTLHMRTGRAAE